MSDASPFSETTPERPFQFTLGHTAVWFVALCFVLAMLSQWGFWGVVVCLVVAAVGVLCYGTYWGEWKLAGAAASILLIFAGAGVFEETGERIGPRTMRCQHKLKQIGMALHCYHDDYGCFPPAFIADASGQPMHSWRVLLLPYMEEQALYARYDFSEPWNGPRNRKLAVEMPEIYRCNDAPGGMTTSTAFLAVRGTTTMWPTSGIVRMSDIQDGLDHTLAVVEVENSGINWLEPRDIELAQTVMAADARKSHEFWSPHRREHDGRRGTWGLFANGSVRFLSSAISRERLRALLTIDGGDNAQLDGK